MTKIQPKLQSRCAVSFGVLTLRVDRDESPSQYSHNTFTSSFFEKNLGKTMSLFALPTSLRARLAIVGSLAGIYVFGYMFYVFGSPLFEGRRQPIQIQEVQVVDEDLSISSPVVITNGGTGPEPDDNLSNKPRVLLVTAFFQLAGSKPIDDTWLQNFLGQITNDIYIFTTPTLESHILQVSNNSKITVDTSYSAPFDIPPLKGKEDAYKQMQKKDRQKSKSHTPELFALRNSKPFFLHTALQKAQVNTSVTYDYVFWSDVASFREEHRYREWPSPSRLREVWEEGSRITGTNSDELMFVPMWGLPHSTIVFWTEAMGPIDNDFSQGMCYLMDPSHCLTLVVFVFL